MFQVTSLEMLWNRKINLKVFSPFFFFFCFCLSKEVLLQIRFILLESRKTKILNSFDIKGYWG